ARIAAVAGDEVNLKITTRIEMVIADRMIPMRVLSRVQPPAIDRLDGARILVSGGTNGIGRAIADEAVRLGAHAEVDGRSMVLDVRDAQTVEEHLAASAGRLGGLDHVVVTAGILRIGSVGDMTPQALAEVI